MIKQFAGASIWSADLNNLLPFYRDTLGLQVVMESPGYVMLGADSPAAPALGLGTHSEVSGRKTYDSAAESWPHATDEIGFADKMNRMPKVVVSTTLEAGSWHPTAVVKKDVAEAVTALKAQPGGNIYIYGSNTLVQLLMQQDLIDEYRLMIYPVVLGGGKRLFNDGIAPAQLKLVESKVFSSGLVALTYQPDRTA